MTREEKELAIEELQGCIIAEEHGKDGKPNGNVTCELTKDTIDLAIKALEQEPTTKNDLGVDCIDRAELLKAMDTWDKFGSDAKGLIPLRTPALQDRYVPYVHYDDMVNCVKGMPSVTPQEPRWIPCSEKKPDKGGEYLLWGKIDESEEEDYCFIGDYHEFDEVFGTEISNYDPKTLGFIDTEIEEYYSVVAWMPLPLPWKGE